MHVIPFVPAKGSGSNDVKEKHARRAPLVKERGMVHEPPEFPGKCYGSATISERGQVVIPAEARRELGLEPATKVLIFGPEQGGVLIVVSADTVTRFVHDAMERLTEFERLINEAPISRHAVE
jgi:AbrB family looped-hinge helix DNA binding protein